MRQAPTPITKKIWTAPVIHKIDLNAAKYGANAGADASGAGHTAS